MNTKEMIAVMQAYEDGKQIEFRVIDNERWVAWKSLRRDRPAWNWSEMDYRIKATKKPVDLSVLIDSGIDCEFNSSVISKLVWIDENGKFKADNGITYFGCRPRMNHIHAWQGGECPLPEGFIVRPIYRDVEAGRWKHEVTAFNWKHHGQGIDIIAFEVIGLADGYCYPWECE